MRIDRRLVPVAFFFSIALGFAALLSAAEVLLLPVADWTARSEAADKALRAGSWEEGRATAEGLISEVLRRPVQGQGLDALLARAVAYRAIGLAGEGKTDSANWAAETARELGFAATDLDLSAFGKPGELVRAALDPAPSDPEPGKVEKGVTRPQILDRPELLYPPALRETKVGGTVIVDSVIGTDGKTSRPHILHSPSIYLSVSALDALQEWRFKPAEREGKPIAVSYVLTVNYSVEPQPAK